MYCGQCGKQIDDGSRFCRHCGAKQTGDEAENLPQGRVRQIGPVVAEPPLVASTAKPKSKVGCVFGVILAVIVGLIFIGSGGKSPTSTTGAISNDAAMTTDMNSVDSLADPKPTDAPPTVAETPWSYSTTDDKVRGSTTFFASTTSTNSVHQDAPYDSDTTMRMTVRKSQSDGTNVVLTISSGQMMCPSYEGCSGTVSFDGGSPQRVRFSGPADSSSDTIFVDGAKAFIAKLKKAKKVVIEKTLYEAGQPQFEFDVHGLKWEH